MKEMCFTGGTTINLGDGISACHQWLFPWLHRDCCGCCVLVVVGCCVCGVSRGCVVVSCGCVMVVAVAPSFHVVAWWLLLFFVFCGWLSWLRRCFLRLRHGCCGCCVLVVVGCCVCVVSGGCVVISGGCVVVVVMVVSCGCVWLLFPAVCVMISVGCIVVVAVVAFCGCGWLSRLHRHFLRLRCCSCAVVFQGCIVVVPVVTSYLAVVVGCRGCHHCHGCFCCACCWLLWSMILAVAVVSHGFVIVSHCSQVVSLALVCVQFLFKFF